VAGNDLSIHVLSNNLTGLIQKQMRAAVAGVVEDTLLDIQDDWAADVRVDTHELQESIEDPDAVQIASDGLSGSVGTGVAHAGPNEYGGPTISARPSARQAAEKNRARFVDGVKRAVGAD
jgi:hypothetical protein